MQVTIGQRLREARKEAGLTQKELGQKLGLSYQAVAQWENNLRKPKPETLQKIAEALDLSIWELVANSMPREFVYGYLSGLEDERRTKTAFNYSFSVEEQNLIDLFAELNPEGQKKAIERVEELTEIPKYQKSITKEKAPDATNIQD